MSTSFSIDTIAVRAAGSKVGRVAASLRAAVPSVDTGSVRGHPLLHRALSGFTNEWGPALLQEIETLGRLGEATVGAANAADTTDQQNAAALQPIDPTTCRPGATR